MGVEVNSTPERLNFVPYGFRPIIFYEKRKQILFFRRKTILAAILVYILLLKHRTHKITQMGITVRIRSFPERSIVLKKNRSLDRFKRTLYWRWGIKAGDLNEYQYFQQYMYSRLFYCIPSRQNCRKSSVEECIFDYMASHIECRFNKNALLQCYFLAILPAGYVLTSQSSPKYPALHLHVKPLFTFVGVHHPFAPHGFGEHGFF